MPSKAHQTHQTDVHHISFVWATEDVARGRTHRPNNVHVDHVRINKVETSEQKTADVCVCMWCWGCGDFVVQLFCWISPLGLMFGVHTVRMWILPSQIKILGTTHPSDSIYCTHDPATPPPYIYSFNYTSQNHGDDRLRRKAAPA